MNHLGLAFRNLNRRPTRSVLTVLGVALAVGSFITLYGLSQSVQENVQQSFEEREADLTVRRSGVAEPFGGTMSQSTIAEIAKIPGVSAVSGQLLSFAATDTDICRKVPRCAISRPTAMLPCGVGEADRARIISSTS